MPPNPRVQRTSTRDFAAVLAADAHSLAAVIVVVAIVVGTLNGCGMCANDVVARVQSPNHAREAVVFQRDCGATTNWSTQISVLDGHGKPEGSGNTFSADDNRDRVSLGPHHTIPVQLKWLGDSRLNISYPRAARVFRQERHVGGVEVVYEVTGG